MGGSCLGSFWSSPSSRMPAHTCGGTLRGCRDMRLVDSGQTALEHQCAGTAGKIVYGQVFCQGQDQHLHSFAHGQRIRTVCQPPGGRSILYLVPPGFQFLGFLLEKEYYGASGKPAGPPQCGGRLAFQTPGGRQRLETEHQGVCYAFGTVGSLSDRPVHVLNECPAAALLQLAPGCGGCVPAGFGWGDGVCFHWECHYIGRVCIIMG